MPVGVRRRAHLEEVLGRARAEAFHRPGHRVAGRLDERRVFLAVGTVGVAEGGHRMPEGLLEVELALDDLPPGLVRRKGREPRVGERVATDLGDLRQLAQCACRQALRFGHFTALRGDVERAGNPALGQLGGQTQVKLVTVIPTGRDVHGAAHRAWRSMLRSTSMVSC
jgi:hypothetical protein